MARHCSLSADWLGASNSHALKMRASFLTWSIAGAVGLALVGCQTKARPRVVRLALNPNSTTWRLSVNRGNQGDSLFNFDLTNRLARLCLHQGDTLLVSCPPLGQSSSAKPAEEWVSDYCQSNSVAVYLTHTLAGIDMFSVRAYHWTAPYDNPFDLSRASFFREGKLLGHGTSGFEEMLRQIAHDRPKQIFILGSMYDFNSSFPPGPSPYEGLSDRLDSTLKAAGTDFIRMLALPGF